MNGISHRYDDSESDSSTDERDDKARLTRRGLMVQQLSRQLEVIRSEWAKHTMDAENVNFRALDQGIKLLNAAVSNMTSNATRMARERVSRNATPEQRRRLRVENMPLYQLAALPSPVAGGSGSGLGGGASASGGDAGIGSGLGGLRRGRGRGIAPIIRSNFNDDNRSSPYYDNRSSPDVT